MAKNTTATEIAPAKLANDEQAKAFKLDPHLINLMWAEPFFSKILRKVTKKESTSIPTAGVLAKEGQLFFWWNRKFLAGLTNDQVKGLLKHECYHLIFEHTTTRRHAPTLCGTTLRTWLSTALFLRMNFRKVDLFPARLSLS